MKRLVILILVIAACGICGASDLGAADEKGKWPGVDEAVVKKFAKEANREAREPLIPTDQGDLLLFVFLAAGAVGGFIGGYYYRELFPPKRREEKGNV
jgi:hypothetical protein